MHFINKKKIFIILIIFLLGGIFELFSYFYFKLNDLENLKNYNEKRKGNLGFVYNKDYGIVVPKPGTKKVLNKSEYKDEYIAKDIFKKGIGIWDNEIDLKREVKMAALGDSFTVGIGAIDPINKNIFSLIEQNEKKFNIINLGGMGKSINDQKYFYDQIKKIIEHDYLIYNFFAGGDFTDNLNDYSGSFYIRNIYKNFSDKELQNFINKLNITNGYKYHLEYLANNDFKIYSIYFGLKIYDMIILQTNYYFRSNILNYGKNNFKKYPQDLGRLKTVSDSNYQLYTESKKTWKIICQKKYCFEHEVIFENKQKKTKIIKNTVDLINNFNKETINDKKSFILILHPSARNFYSKKISKVDYNEMNEILINNLNKNIKVINLSKYLINYQTLNPDEVIFWKRDGHYTPRGYEISSEFVKEKLKQIIFK